MRRRRVTPDSARRFAQQYLRTNARVVVHGVPGKQILAPEPTEGRRRRWLPAGPCRSTPTSRGVRSRLPTAPRSRRARACAAVVSTGERADGHRAARRPARPVVSASLVVRSGQRRQSSRQARPRQLHGGAARSGHRDPQRAAARRRSGADRRVVVDRTSSRMRRRSTTSSLSRNFRGRADAAGRRRAPIRASPPKKSSACARGRLAELVEQRSNPVQIATSVTGAALYGTHPYGFSRDRDRCVESTD